MASLASSTTRALARLSINGASSASLRGAAATARAGIARGQTHHFTTTASTSGRTRSRQAGSSASRAASRGKSQTTTEPKEPDTDALTLVESKRRERVARSHVAVLHSIGWLKHELLESAIADALKPNGRPRQWIMDEWESFRLFRSARARLWEPRFEPAPVPAAEETPAAEGAPSAEAQPAVEAKPTDMYTVEWLTQAIEDHQSRYPEYEGDTNDRIDEILIPVWKVMDKSQRDLALLGARFSCLRDRLGWRHGYTAGYPAAAGQDVDLEARKEVIEKTAQLGSSAHDAMAKLQETDRELAWNAWIDMDPKTRRQEEAAAWAGRDRTLLFIDDTPGKKLLGTDVPRWYHTPQRAGNLVFLPNFTVRLVRNHTPPGEPYDAYKATFRVPLRLHKHSIRSFLLQLYGLRTTWIRSMVYRSPLRMTSRRQLIADNKRTHKKIEVGLLEPFVFPSISEKVKEEHLMAREYEQMQQEGMYKMRARGYVRWRGAVQLADRTASSHLDPWDVDLLEPSVQSDKLQAEQEEKLISGDEKAVAEVKKQREPFVLYKVPQKWTQSHGKILKLLNEKRNAKMALVDQKAQEMREARGS